MLALLLPAAVFKRARRERREAAREARRLTRHAMLGGLAFSASVLLIFSVAEVMHLGEDGQRVLLYDVRRQQTLRLNSNRVELSFPDDC